MSIALSFHTASARTRHSPPLSSSPPSGHSCRARNGVIVATGSVAVVPDGHHRRESPRYGTLLLNGKAIDISGGGGAGSVVVGGVALPGA